jgi:membrane-associated protease RseP (regulator of RpoE activity)
MEDMRPRAPRRETRLLLVTIAVSAAMLLLLARLRFPERPTGEPQAPTQPLERLAASATYDELASILRGVDRQVSGAIITVPAASDSDARGDENVMTYVPAVRIANDRAVALPGAGRLVLPQPGRFEIIAADSPRGVALLHVPSPDTAVTPKLAVLDTLPQAPGYLAAIEATTNGPAVRPLYFGRLDRVNDRRWKEPLLRFSALQQMLPTGAAVFTLDARFIGVGFPDDRAFLVVPAVSLLAEAERLGLRGSVPAADLGIDVQPLDPALRSATGAQSGVVVSYVHPAGPASRQLAAADVITAIGSTGIQSPADYTAALMQLSPGTPVTIGMVRNTAASTVTVTPVARGSLANGGGDALGLELRAVKGAGSEAVRVEPRSAAARAGIRAGDLITGIGSTDAPDPRGVTRAFGSAAAGQHLIVRLERGSAHLVVALTK